MVRGVTLPEASTNGVRSVIRLGGDPEMPLRPWASVEVHWTSLGLAACGMVYHAGLEEPMRAGDFTTPAFVLIRDA